MLYLNTKNQLHNLIIIYTFQAKCFKTIIFVFGRCTPSATLIVLRLVETQCDIYKGHQLTNFGQICNHDQNNFVYICNYWWVWTTCKLVHVGAWRHQNLRNFVFLFVTSVFILKKKNIFLSHRVSLKWKKKITFVNLFFSSNFLFFLAATEDLLVAVEQSLL